MHDSGVAWVFSIHDRQCLRKVQVSVKHCLGPSSNSVHTLWHVDILLQAYSLNSKQCTTAGLFCPALLASTPWRHDYCCLLLLLLATAQDPAAVSGAVSCQFSSSLDLSLRTLDGDHIRPLAQALVDLPPEVARVANQAAATGGDLLGEQSALGANSCIVQLANSRSPQAKPCDIGTHTSALVHCHSLVRPWGFITITADCLACDAQGQVGLDLVSIEANTREPALGP